MHEELVETQADTDFLQVHTVCSGNKHNLEEGDEKPVDTAWFYRPCWSV